MIVWIVFRGRRVSDLRLFNLFFFAEGGLCLTALSWKVLHPQEPSLPMLAPSPEEVLLFEARRSTFFVSEWPVSTRRRVSSPRRHIKPLEAPKAPVSKH